MTKQQANETADLEVQLNKLWDKYLSKQDDAYIEVMNGLTDIRMMHSSNQKIRDILDEVEDYIDKYAWPKGIRERISAYEDAADELTGSRSK